MFLVVMITLELSKIRPGLKDRSKLIVGEDGKVEFWECNLISLNQIGGVIY